MMDFTKNEIEKYKPRFIQKYLADKSAANNIREKKELIFDYNDPFMKRWDALILIFAVWSAVIVPFKVAFDPPVVQEIEIFEAVKYLFFIIDIIVQFRTSYITFEGKFIDDWKLIALRYIFKGPFVFDVIAAIPYNIVTPVRYIL
jgi:hypothetical protein